MEKKENYTRQEVEGLLQEMHEKNIQAIRDHFEEERRNQMPPVWLGVVVLSTIALALWGVILFG